jgi:hypothetical protein
MMALSISTAVPRVFAPWAAAALLALSAASAQAQSALDKLTIESGGRSRVFQVEVMKKDEDRARGLMYRRYLPADRGMLFDFSKEQPVSMWMKNTYIPLDMIFIAKDGKVVSVAENAEPLSERIIPSGGPVLGVLELNGGVAAQIGLKAGDIVKHPVFSSK